ncbi:MAG: 3'-5' exonuclease [Janthinobacterium lividum]
MQELLSLAGGFHNATQLLEHAALASAAPGEDTVGRVQLMTKHKAKGLEFLHVFLAGWDTQCFPSRFGDHDEERRLAYVSLTRGMQRVSISHCAYRAGVARPSPFIDDIPAECRVTGWLHGERVSTAMEMRMERKRRMDEELAVLLRRR